MHARKHVHSASRAAGRPAHAKGCGRHTGTAYPVARARCAGGGPADMMTGSMPSFFMASSVWNDLPWPLPPLAARERVSQSSPPDLACHTEAPQSVYYRFACHTARRTGDSGA